MKLLPDTVVARYKNRWYFIHFSIQISNCSFFFFFPYIIRNSHLLYTYKREYRGVRNWSKERKEIALSVVGQLHLIGRCKQLPKEQIFEPSVA